MNYQALAEQVTRNGEYGTTATALHLGINRFATALSEWHGFNRFDAFRESARMALAEVAMTALAMLRNTGTKQWDLREGLIRRITIFAAPSVIVEPLREYADASQRVGPLINLELLVVTCHELAQRLFNESIHDVVMARLEAK